MLNIFLALGVVVHIGLFSAIGINFYTNTGVLRGLLSDGANQKTKMLRLQFLLVSILGPLIYLFLVISKGSFPIVPGEGIVIMGVSSLGYLGAKGVGIRPSPA